MLQGMYAILSNKETSNLVVQCTKNNLEVVAVAGTHDIANALMVQQKTRDLQINNTAQWTIN